MIENILTTIQNNPEKFVGLFIIILEFIVRLKPTKINLSILDLIHNIINVILPNLKKTGEDKKADRIEELNGKIKDKFKVK